VRTSCRRGANQALLPKATGKVIGDRLPEVRAGESEPGERAVVVEEPTVSGTGPSWHRARSRSRSPLGATATRVHGRRHVWSGPGGVVRSSSRQVLTAQALSLSGIARWVSDIGSTPGGKAALVCEYRDGWISVKRGRHAYVVLVAPGTQLTAAHAVHENF